MSLSFNLKLGDATTGTSAPLEETVGAAKTRLGMEGRWIYKGRILADTLRISETGINAGECVIVVRPSGSQAQSPPPATQPQTPTSSTPTPSASYFSPAMGMHRAPLTASMDVAMNALLTNAEDVVTQCLATVAKITTNIISNPHEAKFRSIPASNRAFDAKVGSVQGGPQLMMALGFELSPAAQWVLQPSAERWEVLQACHAKITAFSERLRLASAAGAGGVGERASSAASAPPVDAPAPSTTVASETGAVAPPVDPAVVLLLASLGSLAVRDGGGGVTPDATPDSGSSASPPAPDAPPDSPADA